MTAENDSQSIFERIRLRRNYAGAFLAVAIASGGTFTAHEIRNGWKADFLAGVGAVITAGSLGAASGNFREYRRLSQLAQDSED